MGNYCLFSARGAGHQLLTQRAETFTARAQEREIWQAGSLDPAKEIVDSGRGSECYWRSRMGAERHRRLGAAPQFERGWAYLEGSQSCCFVWVERGVFGDSDHGEDL